MEDALLLSRPWNRLECMTTGEKEEDMTSVLRIWAFIPWPADDGASTAKDSDNDSDNESSSDSDRDSDGRH